MGRPKKSTVCGVAGCLLVEYAKKLCKMHYNRVKRHGDADAGTPARGTETLAEYFAARINKTETCWLWTGTKHRGSIGYGLVCIHPYNNKLAHRASWEIHNGEIPSGMNVLHRCDVPLCVNPEHLFVGTTQDNVDDKAKKRRHKFGSTHPHAKLTEEIVVSARKRNHAGEGIKSLANEFGVCYYVMRMALRGHTWSHVKRE